ncbi:General secretion pathway protein D [uncultured Desulfobacterium sp.]|uniref:General secretion pathway protein D n=1 Tax=uncultured Desulfobacterium sp. TaxID=201089 RepID=A0A445MSP3_9BACT|nr:General secretion pathway protein D [uncultured Desulfobacterium sp.]
MIFKSETRYAFCLFLIGLWLLTGSSIALGARVAGEEGASPVSSGPGQMIKPKMPPDKAEKPIPRALQTRPVEQESVKDKIENNENGEQIQDKKPDKEEKSDERYVTIDFDNVDIAIFIKFMSELTGKNFVVDKGVTGKVTVISPTKISVDEAYEVFESVLEVYGFASIPAGDIVKIVPAATAKSKDIETLLRKEAASPDDKIVTQLIPLKYADPVEVKKVFDPLVSKNSLIVPYAPTDTLIITDVLSNVRRLSKIIQEIDVEGVGEQISVIPLVNATASVLEKSLSAIFQRGAVKAPGQAAIEGTVKITSDERTNSLIVFASENDTRKVKELIKLLDTDIPRGEGDIHVYYLQNGSAEDMANVLKAIPTDQKDEAAKGKVPVVSKDVQIVADKATNSLVITANKADYLVLESVIKKLDIIRRMVYIEALIMEVGVKKSFNIGVEWKMGKQNIGDFGGKNVGGFIGSTSATSTLPDTSTSSSSGTDSTTATSSLSMPSGFAFGVLGEGIQIGRITFPSIAAVVNAYESDSDVNILSTPQIMTTDNEEAEIVVANNIPYLTRRDEGYRSSSTAVDYPYSGYSNYEFKDVGVTLNITPQINQERFVKLKISQEISQVKEVKTEGLPTTLKRQAKTVVIIKDGQTVVIGGLIDETLNKSDSRVPCLGTIPGIGQLFKSFSTSTDKTNLFIFITPHIVENPEEAKELYEGKKEEFKGVTEGTINLYEEPGSNDKNKVIQEIE